MRGHPLNAELIFDHLVFDVVFELWGPLDTTWCLFFFFYRFRVGCSRLITSFGNGRIGMPHIDKDFQ